MARKPATTRATAGADPRTVVLVGASSGIGRAVAERLAERGDRLVLVARRSALLEELVAVLPSEAIAVSADATRPGELDRVADEALRRFGGFDAWVNLVGVGAIGIFTDIPRDDHLRVVESTLHSAVLGSHVALSRFAQTRRGVLVNIGSVAGKVALPYFTSYAAAKFGVVGLSAALHREVRDLGLDDVHVCVVNPWVTDTPWFDHARNYTGHTLRMPLPHDVDQPADAIVDVLDDPKEEVNVGVYGTLSATSAGLARGATEAISARLIGAYARRGVPMRPHSGALHEPSWSGRGDDGGARERIAEEDRTGTAETFDEPRPPSE